MDADCLGIPLLQYYYVSVAEESNKSSEGCRSHVSAGKVAHLEERLTYDSDNFYVWDLIAELQSGRGKT